VTLLTSTSDIIRVVTGSGVSTIEVQASYVDLASGSYTPGSTETEITTATTTTVVAAPGASTYRKVKRLSLLNNSASSCQVTVQKYNGTIAADLMGVTLLAGELLTRNENGEWRHKTAAGGDYESSVSSWANYGISGSLAETTLRHLCTENNATVTSGTLVLAPIWLKAGTVVTNISFFSGGTAAVAPTNQFFALYTQSLGLVAASANATTAAWAANTIKTLAMTAAYTVPVSKMYYVGIMVTATTTMPTIKQTVFGTAVRALPLILGGSSTTGLTTVLPNPCAAPASPLNYWAAVT
jgi:hypothetical protein